MRGSTRVRRPRGGQEERSEEEFRILRMGPLSWIDGMEASQGGCGEGFRPRRDPDSVAHGPGVLRWKLLQTSELQRGPRLSVPERFHGCASARLSSYSSVA